MKKVLLIVTAMIILAMISSCATSKKFITIKEPDIIYERGEEKFEVIPNDTLEIIETKTCRDGIGICWKVKKIGTGEVGYVKADWMNEKHEVYTKEK